MKMHPNITHEITKLVRDSKLPLSEEEFDSVVVQAIQAGADRIATAEAGKLLLADYPYLTVTMVVGDVRPSVGNEAPRCAAIVSFISRMGDSPVTHTAAYYNGYIVQTQTVLEELHHDDLWKFVEFMDEKCESVESSSAINELWATSAVGEDNTAIMSVPEGMVDLVLEGRGTATKAANEKNFPALMKLTGGDRRKQDIINACSSACDGVMGEYERRLVKMSNELPMMMQEAKSYALHTAEELLKPFRDRQHAVMSGWGSW